MIYLPFPKSTRKICHICSYPVAGWELDDTTLDIPSLFHYLDSVIFLQTLITQAFCLSADSVNASVSAGNMP